ncbi:uncharacterized protein AMSG_02338 [Thecamonas trahens ATCC 50062]|uniref:NTF2 domain-containing protein n=1 Tax=Thecamonas trahens ATCC 50062 TaxID=461836 RepID=A0A0L0DXW0_THETB|nr:hypothetical protein AMSG_02338 [Thecamonas trahens ATCC 50062]KNC56368.1 hypothetical protein AMSG_02338 [Thecamonas trahens ATCC 50062]|eukprot:XP_013760883.1 hypothetical protein AMSG_02338 [Thecamonas trahens ATCC 50062]
MAGTQSAGAGDMEAVVARFYDGICRNTESAVSLFSPYAQLVVSREGSPGSSQGCPQSQMAQYFASLQVTSVTLSSIAYSPIPGLQSLFLLNCVGVFGGPDLKFAQSFVVQMGCGVLSSSLTFLCDAGVARDITIKPLTRAGTTDQHQPAVAAAAAAAAVAVAAETTPGPTSQPTSQQAAQAKPTETWAKVAVSNQPAQANGEATASKQGHASGQAGKQSQSRQGKQGQGQGQGRQAPPAEHFAAFGNLKGVFLRDKLKFGYVDFCDAQALQAALGVGSIRYGDVTVRILPKSKSGKGNSGKGNSGKGNSGNAAAAITPPTARSSR